MASSQYNGWHKAKSSCDEIVTPPKYAVFCMIWSNETCSCVQLPTLCTCFPYNSSMYHESEEEHFGTVKKSPSDMSDADSAGNVMVV